MKKVIGRLIIFLIIAFGVILFFTYSDTKDPYIESCDYTIPESDIPTFTEVQIEFEHQFNDETDLPVMAGVLIDIDNDGVDEIFVGGASNQKDGLFKYENGEFRNISSALMDQPMTKSSTLGAVSFDLDEDGNTDLLVARTEGVFLLKNDSGSFYPHKLDILPNEKSNPISFTLGDFDRDGDADIFLCTYLKVEKMEGQTIFNDLKYGANSLMLRNDGDLKFTDVTHELGLEYTHNTFQAVMVDFDRDGWLDLAVAYDTGEPKIFRNKEGKKFEEVKTPLSGKYAYPMGIAFGDFNNDGWIDLFFSNTGSTVPDFLARGDLEEGQDLVTDWMLFANRGNMKFEDVSESSKVAAFEFSWGAILEDFNLDGKQDLAVAENYIAFPGNNLFKLPCRLLLQRNDGTFAAVEEQANAQNKNYAITPLSSDFNQDGYPDLVYTNLQGPLRVLMNDGGNGKYIKVTFPERSEFVGATATVRGNFGSLTDVYAIGEGLCSDNTNVLTFGIQQDTIPEVAITYLSGKQEIFEDVAANSTLLAGTGRPDSTHQVQFRVE